MSLENIITENEFNRLEEIYKMFGSVPRLKILLRLSEGECNATELASFSNLSQSATSHQLKDLKSARIVKHRKDGLNIFYSLDDEHIVTLIKIGLAHVKGENCYDK